MVYLMLQFLLITSYRPCLQVLQQPHGITIFEDNIYWSDRYTSQIMKTNKFHGGNITTLLTSVYQCMGITMDHPVKQPLG